jgi:hypothetical protein
MEFGGLQLSDIVPYQRAIHAIVDSYATHKHPKVKAWLAPSGATLESLHTVRRVAPISGGHLV